MYRKHYQSWRKHLDFIIIDLICLQIAFILAYAIRHREINPYATTLYRNTAVMLTIISAITAVFMESFKDVLKRGYYQEFLAALRHVAIVLLISILYLYLTQSGEDYSRLFNLYTALIYLGITYFARIMWKEYLKRRGTGAGRRTLLVVTNNGNTKACVDNIKEGNYGNYHVVGIAVINKKGGAEISENSIKIVADEESLIDYVCREWVDEILVDMPLDEGLPGNIMHELNKIGVVVHTKVARESEMIGRKQFTETLGQYTVLTTTMNYASPGQLFAKRMMDIAGGIVGCIITGIIYIFLMPVIKIKSPGPVFFTQIRVGQNGRQFKIHKFRTMYMDAEKRKAELMNENTIKDNYMFKLDFDPRVIGNKVMPDGSVKRGLFDFMRRYSIDEMPQFYDVLIGNMSLVGTRPPTVEEVEKYSSHHYARLAVKPGITGMWQVSGRSNITDFEEVVRLDTEYINNWDLGLDIKILFKTLAVVVKGEGSK